MDTSADMLYPKKIYTHWYKDFYTRINGTEVREDDRGWDKQKWNARVFCSRGPLLEKAGILNLEITEGNIYDSPGTLNVFETLAYPSNPVQPGLIVMTNRSTTESRGTTIVFYCDLIMQNGVPGGEEKTIFQNAVMTICQKHGYDYDAYRPFLEDQGLLGGSAGECGIMGFFEEKDSMFTENLIEETIALYSRILELGKGKHPQEKDFKAMFASRARMVEWLSVLDYGVKVVRDNDIPLEVLESYGFPPLVKY